MEALASAFWQQAIPAVAGFLDSLNPHLRELPTTLNKTSGNASGWFLAPETHALEVFTITLPTVLLLLLLSCLHHPRDTTLVARKTHVPKNGTWEIIDRVVAAVCTASHALLVVGKFLTGRQVYLFGPCNTMSALLVYFFIDKSSRFAELLFNFYLCTGWGVLMAIGTPDTRGQVYSFEYPHFYVTHILELAVPVYLLARRQYAVHSSFKSTVWYAALDVLVHFVGFEIISIVSEQNLNYMMQPPPPLVRFGQLYRYAACAGGMAATIVFRHVVVDGVIALLNCFTRRVPSDDSKAKIE